MSGRSPYQAQLFNLANEDFPLKYAASVRLAPAKLRDLRLLFNLLDNRGRAWLENVFTSQGQSLPKHKNMTVMKKTSTIPRMSSWSMFLSHGYRQRGHVGWCILRHGKPFANNYPVN
ncbi:hypothetical protein GWK47_012117 [Chionoecetes opilio]|uniref:Uncharacterized protein n=1 Tax=Chionoecetes opilio TaxID=41210 RepID=A0A8J5CM59_CHIOP|nr:hypothetical protein GWK47_012117 [Chionoecetes opilio]